MAGLAQHSPLYEAPKPDYYGTVRFIYQKIDFHISEDEAYDILDAFIEKWDTCVGELVYDDDFKEYVYTKLEFRYFILGKKKVHRVVEIILDYLRSHGFFGLD